MKGGPEPLPDPPRGFPPEEFAARTSRAQTRMAAVGADAMLLTTEPEVRYFSGFHTPFWRSPSRPWFLIVPKAGKPTAVIPEIGVARMRETFSGDIRAWPSPRPDDEGVSELCAALRAVAGPRGTVALATGPETRLRMPLSDFRRMQSALDGMRFADATPILKAPRIVKSELEVAKIRRACRAASDAFAAAPKLFSAGMRESEIFRALKMECLRRGADDAPYVAGGAAPDGIRDIIAPPSERELRAGDLLTLDLGCAFDGYFSDFNRNFAVGRTGAKAARAHAALFRATDAGLAAARPGAACADVFRAMAKSLQDDGAQAGTTGRMGHGVGMALTEWPSVSPDDKTVLTAGTVLALEPSAVFDSGIAMTHEENIVVRDGPPELLSRRAAAELPEI